MVGGGGVVNNSIITIAQPTLSNNSSILDNNSFLFRYQIANKAICTTHHQHNCVELLDTEPWLLCKVRLCLSCPSKLGILAMAKQSWMKCARIILIQKKGF